MTNFHGEYNSLTPPKVADFHVLVARGNVAAVH